MRLLQRLLGEPVTSIIIPLDVATAEEAIALVDRMMACGVRFFKVGLQLLMTGRGYEVTDYIRKKGCHVFLDGKFHDIPNTVAGAVGSAFWHSDMMNVHCAGGRKMMEAAVNAAKALADSGTSLTEVPAIIGVTVLTSLGYYELVEAGELVLCSSFPASVEELKLLGPHEQNHFLAAQASEVQKIVLERAVLAQDSGLDGVVASPLEAAAIRQRCGKDFIIVTPGIRFDDNKADDQRRKATPESAVQSGANFVVMGRPIYDADDPAAAVERAVREIQAGRAAA